MDREDKYMAVHLAWVLAGLIAIAVIFIIAANVLA